MDIVHHSKETLSVFTSLFDLGGVLIGMIAIAIALMNMKRLGGRVAASLQLFIASISMMILSFLWTLLSPFFRTVFPNLIDIHGVLMAIGIILFAFAARKLASVVQV